MRVGRLCGNDAIDKQHRDSRNLAVLCASWFSTPPWDIFVEGSKLSGSLQRRDQGSRGRVLALEQSGRSWLAGLRFKR